MVKKTIQSIEATSAIQETIRALRGRRPDSGPQGGEKEQEVIKSKRRGAQEHDPMARTSWNSTFGCTISLVAPVRAATIVYYFPVCPRILH